jgi:hypothetical protein
VAEEIEAHGVDAVRAEVEGRGLIPDEPQPMTVWVSALTVLKGPLWEALQVG